MGAIIRLTLGFFLSLLLHLFLIGGFLYLGRTLAQTPHRIEPKAMVLDMSMFAPPSSKPKPQKKPLKENKTPKPPHHEEVAPTPATPKIPIAILHKNTDQVITAPKLLAIPHPQIIKQIEPKKPQTKQKTNKRRKANKSNQNRKKRKIHQKKLPNHTARARRKYIRHNLGRIMRISQQTLLRLGIPRVRGRHRSVRATASFWLHPDGHISGLHLSRRSSVPAIDRRTLQVIRRAHRRYPHPNTKVPVRITMKYRL